MIAITIGIPKIFVTIRLLIQNLADSSLRFLDFAKRNGGHYYVILIVQTNPDYVIVSSGESTDKISMSNFDFPIGIAIYG